MVISLKDDHVSAWQATYDGAKLLGGETRFLLGGSGHNAGVINPPSANKHGYWTNDAHARHRRSTGWRRATRHEGRGGREWQQWLVRDGARAGEGAASRRRRSSRRRAATCGCDDPTRVIPDGSWDPLNLRRPICGSESKCKFA